jgi:hypothetical protein
MLAKLFSIALIAYLPGALIFRIPIAERHRRAALAAEERAFWGVILSIIVSASVVLGLAAVEQYTFDRLVLANGLVSLALLLAFNLRLRYGARTGFAAGATAGADARAERAPWPTASAVLPVLLILIGAWLYFPGAEYVMGGKDPGTYVNEGIQIAQRGSLVTHDAVIATVPREFRDLFFPSHLNPFYYSTRFMGFFLMDPNEGTVLGQFPHLFPASLAVGYGVEGLNGVRDMPGVWAILGLLAVYFAGARLFGRAAAFAGALLLAINVIQVWFARYPNAEMVMQALLFAALLAWSRAHVDDDLFFAPVSATLLGLLLFLRFDTVLAFGGVAVAAGLGLASRKRPSVAFLVALQVWLALAAWYLLGLMRPYTAYPIGFIHNLAWWELGLLGVALLALVVFAIAAPHLRVLQVVDRRLPVVLTVAVLMLAIYAYFFRFAGGRTTEYDAGALRSFAWYITPVGLAAALAGYALAMRESFRKDPVLLATVTIFALFFFYKIKIVPEHYWMTRRFLPVILPGALLLIGAAAFAWWRGDTRRMVIRGTIGTVLVALLVVRFWSASAPLRSHVEYAGIIPKLEEVVKPFGDRDLVIVESRNASDLHVFALPMAYIYARNVLVLNSPRPDAFLFSEFLKWARTQYDAIYFMGGGGTELLSRAVGIQPVASERFQIPEWQSAYNAVPQGVRRKEFDYSVYRLVDSTAAATAVANAGARAAGGAGAGAGAAGGANANPNPNAANGGAAGAAGTGVPGGGGPGGGAVVDLDVGFKDDLNVVRFHAKERDGHGITFRWTRDRSYISLLGVRPESRTVELVLNDGHRPPKLPRAHVQVLLNDRVLGELDVKPDFHSYTLAIPPDVAAAAAKSDAPARLTLVSNIWRPRDVLGTPDDRDLGVMVDRVEVR